MAVLHRGRTNVYSLEYHVVFVTKYRRKALTEEIREDLAEYIAMRCRQRGVTLLEANGEEDHLHLLIDARPDTDIPNLLKVLKGASARHVFSEHPEVKEILWCGHLWSPSYFICTVSENTEEHVREYIRNQGEAKPDREHQWEATRRKHARKAARNRG